MSSGMRPAGIQPPDMAEAGAIKSWLDALASGSCDAPAFLRAMQLRFSSDPDGTWEVLSQLDQYYRRGRIEAETFKAIKKALAESVLGLGPIPAAAGPVLATLALAVAVTIDVMKPTTQLTPTSVAAEIKPPTSELSPAFMEFCTEFDRTSKSTRSKGASWPICRLPLIRRRTIRNVYTITQRKTNMTQRVSN